MFALVESGSITKYLNGNKGLKIGDIQYPPSIYRLWSESERNDIGIYSITVDGTNKKDERWYINTDVTYAFGSGKVTGTYGSATARPHADTLYTQEEEDAGDGTKDDVKTEGLKTILIRAVKEDAENILNKTDWYITRKAEKSTAIPSAITTHRNAVRTKQASMCTAITNASDTPALETLYTYTKQDDGSVTRPLGELPTL
jgi:hypothetical protein